MSSMKQYLNSFRVNAGLAPDDRVLSESALAEAEETNEMERKLMEVLESAAKSKGKDNWSKQAAEWTEEHSAGGGDEGYYNEWEVECSAVLPLAAARPNVVRRKDGSIAVVNYLFASPKGAGKVERNLGALTAASKKGLSKSMLNEAKIGSPAAMRMEPSLEPPDYGDDNESKEYTYGSSRYGEEVTEEGIERIEEMLYEKILDGILPDLIEKALPDFALYDYNLEMGGSEPNHYGWSIAYLKPKK
jgi:hypothetical protein